MAPALTSEQKAALASVVRQIRADLQRTQEEVGELGGLGRKEVGAIERGEVSPSLATLAGVARGLDVSLTELVGLYERRLASRRRARRGRR